MLESIVALGLALLGVIVWSVRQEGRINGHDELFKSQDKLDLVKQTLADERHQDIKERLGRIEKKIETLHSQA